MKNYLTSVFRAAIITALFVMISGVMPLIVQGYAWIDMARKAGGIEQLGAVISDGEPCCICEMAQEMSESSPSNGKNPFFSKGHDLLMGLSSSNFEPLANVIAELDQKFPIPGDLFPPPGKEVDPATPPPQSA